MPDFCNDVVHLTASFALYRRPEILKLLKKKLELFDEDLTERPLPSCPNLRFFIQRDQVPRPSSPGSAEVMYDDTAFRAEQAQRVVDEAPDQWEDVKLTVETDLFLQNGLVESGIALEYRFLRGFLAHGSDMFHKAIATSTQAQLKRAQDTIEVSTPEEEAIAILDVTKEGLEDQKMVAVNAKDLVIEVYRNVERIIGYAGLSRLSIEKGVYGALMSSTIKRLKNIVTTAKKFTEDLRGLNGDQLCGDTLPDIWESFNNSIDLDLAKATFGQAVRYAIAELASANIDLGDMVEEVAGQLSNLGLEV